MTHTVTLHEGWVTYSGPLWAFLIAPALMLALVLGFAAWKLTEHARDRASWARTERKLAELRGDLTYRQTFGRDPWGTGR